MSKNGYTVLYRSGEDRPLNTCYWSDNYYEAYQYADMVNRMFPEMTVIMEPNSDE